MRFIIAVAVFIFLSLTPLMALSKGLTTRILITGPGLDGTLAIKSPEIVDRFHIWNGPGVGASVNGIPLPPVHLDPNKPEGRFIDWPRGMATQPPESPRYEVSFYCDNRGESDRFCYRVNYAAGEEGGYIYVPKWSDPGADANNITHGVEGNWFYSTVAWEDLVRPLLVLVD